MTTRSISEADPAWLPDSLLRAPSRLRVYRFIVDRVGAGGRFPTNYEICEYMGWARIASAEQALRTLYGIDRVVDRVSTGKRTPGRPRENSGWRYTIKVMA